jgi:hypothetical protein
MLLAEIEVWHSRPFTPTRRVALGHIALPAEPAPGFGGVLLGGVVAQHIGAIDPDLHPDIHRLINQVARGERVLQPRLRYRFQVDRHGLGRSVHRLTAAGEQIRFDFQDHGPPLPQVLAAIYAAERLNEHARSDVCTALHQSAAWTGPIGPSLIEHLSGVSAAVNSVLAFGDPVGWALHRLGFAVGEHQPGRKEVMSSFRRQVRLAHPDHGGDEALAARLLAEITEARRILLS